MNQTYKIPWITYIILGCISLAGIITIHILKGWTPKFDLGFLLQDIILVLSILSIVLISSLLYQKAQSNNQFIPDGKLVINFLEVVYKIFCLGAYYSLFRLVMLYSLYSTKTSEPAWIVNTYVKIADEATLHFIIVVAYFIVSYFLISISKTSSIFQTNSSVVPACAGCASASPVVSPFLKTFKWFLVVLGGSILLPIVLTILTNGIK